MSYLDIDEILSEEERIPCVFSIDATGLGNLDSTNELPDLPAHSKVELPLWLAQMLSEKNMIEIELPKHYGSRIREDIMAGATAVPLREYSYYYFEVGWKLSRLMRDADLRKTLRIAFTGERYKALLARAMAKYDSFSSSTSLILFIVGMTTLQTTLTTSPPQN
jgi:GINS complex subunit 3